MSDSPDRQPPPSEASPDDADMYDVAETEGSPTSNDRGPWSGSQQGSEPATWFVALPTGGREGPFPLSVLKQRIAAGSLTRDNVIWQEGMSGWRRAGEVAALFETPAPGPTPPPLGPGTSPLEESSSDDRDVSWRAASDEMMQRCDSLFNQAFFFRAFGRISAALAIFMTVVAVIAAIAGNGGLFVYVFWFVLLFLIGEAAAAVLDRLGEGE